jgi:hypothetical protein
MMPKEVKYTENTPFSELVAAYALKSKTAVCTAAQNWNKQYLTKTLGDMAGLSTRADYDPSWGIWLLRKFGEEIDIAIRKRLIIAIKDPMTAFELYLELPWLTDEEDKLLEEKFKGKLPTTEADLGKGIVKRAKEVKV